MAKFEKLSQAEIEKMRRRKTPTQGLLDPYLKFLDGLNTGDWGSVEIEEGETQRAVKRRLTTASKQKGVEIKYKKSEEGKVLFEVR